MNWKNMNKKKSEKVVGFSAFPYPGAPIYSEPKTWYSKKIYMKKFKDGEFMCPYNHTAIRTGKRISNIKALQIWRERLKEMKYE